jgi:hypothetical protein
MSGRLLPDNRFAKAAPPMQMSDTHTNGNFDSTTLSSVA